MTISISRLGAALLAVVLGASGAHAQRITIAPDLDLVLAGGIQPRASLGVDAADEQLRYGAGIRRARIQARVLYRDWGGVEYDVDGGTGTVESVDLFAFANLTPTLQARVGYMPVAQPQGGVITPYPVIDAVDRAAVVERWLAGTVGGDGRDLGAALAYTASGTSAMLSVHNGGGTFNTATNNYRQGISSPDVVGGEETAGLAVSASVRTTVGPGIEMGGFAGFNGAAPARTDRSLGGRDYVTGGAHVYWGAVPGSQPIRVKLDALALRYEDDGVGSQSSLGASLLGAVGVRESAEVFARGEGYWGEDAADAYLTAGFSVSPSAALGGPYERARLTLAYQYRFGDTVSDAHLAVLQGQIAF